MAKKTSGLSVVPRARKEVVAISVNLEVLTPDKLKKIIFGLTKGTNEGLTTWTINFELYDREKVADQFTKVIDLDVEVKTKHNELAQETADKGLNRPQVEHLITRAAPAAARLNDGTITRASADRAIEGTLSKRTDG